LFIGFTVPADDFHAGIAAGAQRFDYGASPLAATQNIDALVEDGKTDDSFISQAPENQRYCKKRDPNDKDIRTYVQIRVKIDNPGQSERENAEDEQQAKVYLPAFRDAPRFIQIVLIREKQGEDGDSRDFRQAVFIDQNDVTIRSNEARGGQQK
jgi:hypothetical protein